MTKTLCILLTFLFLLQSCSLLTQVGNLKQNETPNYTQDKDVSKKLIENQEIVTSADSTKTIIVYNVIEKDDNKIKLSDETIRLLIADLFGTITTVLTLKQLDNNNNP